MSDRRSRQGKWAWRSGIGAACGVVAIAIVAQLPAQAPAPPPPPVVGRDPAEPAQVIGKQFQLKVWLAEVGGPGMHKIHVVRLGEDGNLALPGIAATKAEGLTIAALEEQLTKIFKATAPNARVRVSITDREPPPPPATQESPSTQPTTAPSE